MAGGKNFFKAPIKKKEDEKQVSSQTKSASGRQIVEVFVVGFVIKKIPFGDKIVFHGSEVVI